MASRVVLWDLIEQTKVTCPGGIEVSLVSAHPETWFSDQCSEHLIAAAARTSFNNFSLEKTPEEDTRLIRRLYNDRHTSPLEMVGLTFQIKAPKFVTIQLLRHRSLSFNEESQRYHEIKEGFFHPSSDPDRFIRIQDPKNRQSSIMDSEKAKALQGLFQEIEGHLDQVLELYHQAIEIGAARECARFCLPLSTWSTIVIQVDLHNLTHLLRLRLASDAQYETQLVARAIYHLAKQVFPIVMGAFTETLTKEMSIDDTGFVYA